MGMRRYLLVLDMDLLAMDEEHDLPISYLVARQGQEPCTHRRTLVIKRQLTAPGGGGHYPRDSAARRVARYFASTCCG